MGPYKLIRHTHTCTVHNIHSHMYIHIHINAHTPPSPTCNNNNSNAKEGLALKTTPHLRTYPPPPPPTQPHPPSASVHLAHEGRRPGPVSEAERLSKKGWDGQSHALQPRGKHCWAPWPCDHLGARLTGHCSRYHQSLRSFSCSTKGPRVCGGMMVLTGGGP